MGIISIQFELMIFIALVTPVVALFVNYNALSTRRVEYTVFLTFAVLRIAWFVAYVMWLICCYLAF